MDDLERAATWERLEQLSQRVHRAIDALDTVAAGAALDEMKAIVSEHPHDPVTVRLEDGNELMLAKLDAIIAMRHAGVSEQVMRFVLAIGPERYPDEWALIKQNVYPDVHEQGLAIANEQRLTLYCQMAVALDTQLPAAEKAAIKRAERAYYVAFIDPKRSSDYANGETDLVQRLQYGCERLTSTQLMSPQQSEFFLADLEMFRSAAARHEYSYVDVQRVLERLERANKSVVGSAATQVREELERLRLTLLRYRARGPAHLEALEQQWRAFRYNAQVQRAAELMGAGHLGALQVPTVQALRAATAYCWSPMPVEAVAAAATSMPPDAAFSPETLGELAAPVAAGWWWFEEPIPVQTLITPGDESPVVALLWRREVLPSGEQRIFFNTFVLDTVPRVPGEPAVLAPTPTASWLVPDGLRLDALEAELRRGYESVEKRRLSGHEAAGVDVTVTASLWFTRFFLAAAVWLRERIATTSRGQGVRQLSRQLAREHKLVAPPTVEIVQLRRREVSMERAGGPAAHREFSCRWVVHGHMRNQWYPSTGSHKVIWIESYTKGPDDKPLKVAARVYAVTR